MSDSEYHFKEEDVETALKFLRLHLPKYATPENAIKVLVYMHNKVKPLDKLSSEDVEVVLQDFETH
jgi:hypothetical protein